jgi:hypothetical protein
MAYEPKEGSGALFKSDKGDNPQRPDYRGDIMLDGVMYEISGWIKPKPSNPAEKFMSLSGKPKQARQQAPAPRQAPPAAKPAPSGFDDMDDDIPF